ncbi:MAG TPA: NAD(P)H-dependent glycerol-3-phosphate dehydrogenase [Candidatus Eisenbacteria bacterium]|nr:NAD(P)H-dependent glycerol-3-phosphate dehydrogenase [Candidatus Eisenbacteria bacterium]
MNIAVIGGGGWGTALAALLTKNGHTVRLWVYEADLAERMGRERRNDVFLPGVPIPEAVAITADLAEAAADSSAILFATPSHALRATASRLAAEKTALAARLVVIATKGLEKDTHRRMSEVVQETLAAPLGTDPVVLAGPSHAEEVARGIPTAVVAACRDHGRAAAVQEAFSSETFRVYTNDDVLGVEIAVALKNVVAIAAGISDGLGFGDSTKGALLTRGLAEMARLGEALGARPETFSGLAGMGDLIATATSRHSRNRRLGEAVGRGATLAEALAASPMVAEGVGTAQAAVDLAARLGIELPIAEQVRAILYEGKSARSAMRELLTRDLKPEARTVSRR